MALFKSPEQSLHKQTTALFSHKLSTTDNTFKEIWVSTFGMQSLWFAVSYLNFVQAQAPQKWGKWGLPHKSVLRVFRNSISWLRCTMFFSSKWLYNNYSMSPSWIWSDKITNERVARVGYNHFISNKGEWNNCFSKFSNGVLPPISISTILQSIRKEHTTSGHLRLDSRHHLSIT